MSQKTKTIIGLAAALAVIVGLILIADPSLLRSKSGNANTASSDGSGVITADQDFYDFGTISMAAGKVSHVFNVKNESPASVKAEKLYTSCMCTVASLTTKNGKSGPFGMQGHGFIPRINEVISPGETAQVEVMFDPAAHGPQGVGKVRRVVYLETDSVQSPAFQLSFEANVTP